MGDRPPPAPWAEELKARTNRQANHNNSAPNSTAPPFAKPPAVAPKSAFGGRPATSSVALAQKLNQTSPPISVAPKPSPPVATSSLPPPPAAPPAPPAPPTNTASAPPSNHIKSSPFASQTNANQNPPAAVPVSQPKTMPSPHSYNQPMKTPPASAVCCGSIFHACWFFLHSIKAILNVRFYLLHLVMFVRVCVCKHSRRPPAQFLSQAEVFLWIWGKWKSWSEWPRTSLKTWTHTRLSSPPLPQVHVPSMLEPLSGRILIRWDINRYLWPLEHCWLIFFIVVFAAMVTVWCVCCLASADLFLVWIRHSFM